MSGSGWDGVWASVVGGLFSGLTVLFGILLTQRLSDKRSRQSDERSAANALIIEVANLRDAAVVSAARSRTGRYDLWPLRHRLYLSHALHGYPVRQGVQNFYEATSTLRDWVRRGPVAEGDLSDRDRRAARVFDEYRAAIGEWGDLLVEALTSPEKPIGSRVLTGPERPTLP